MPHQCNVCCASIQLPLACHLHCLEQRQQLCHFMLATRLQLLHDGPPAPVTQEPCQYVCKLLQHVRYLQRQMVCLFANNCALTRRLHLVKRLQLLQGNLPVCRWQAPRSLKARSCAPPGDLRRQVWQRNPALLQCQHAHAWDQSWLVMPGTLVLQQDMRLHAALAPEVQQSPLDWSVLACRSLRWCLATVSAPCGVPGPGMLCALCHPACTHASLPGGNIS